MSAAFREACRRGDKEGARRALESIDDGELAELVERIGGARAMVRFLVQRRHVLDPEPVVSTASWLRGHLAEAEPIHLLDVEPARIAAETGGHAEIARRLRSHQQFLQPPDPMRWSRPVPTEEEVRFWRACAEGAPDEAQALLEARPELARAVDPHGLDGIAHAAPHGDATLELTAAMVEAGARPSAATLGLVAGLGAARSVELLLGHGWPVRQHIDDDALRIAVSQPAVRGSAAVLEMLTRAGADPNACDRWGHSMWGASDAARRRQLEGLGARTEATGAKTYDPDTGMSARLAAIVNGAREASDDLDLNEAAAAGDVTRVEALLDGYGQTPRLTRHGPPERPMHLAAFMGRVDVIHRLIARGYSPAEVNAPMAHGHHVGPRETWNRSAITVAAARGHDEAIYVLMNSVDFVQGRRARRK